MCGERKERNRLDENIFLAKLEGILKLYDEIDIKTKEIDDEINSFNMNHSDCDKEIEDYKHMLEIYDLTDSAKIAIADKISNIAVTRRNTKRKIAIGAVWNKHNTRLDVKQNRIFAREAIRRTIANMETEYKDRIISPDVKNKLLQLGVEKDDSKKKQIRMSKNDPRKKEAIEDLKNGESVQKLSKKYGINVCTLYLWKKTYVK